MAKRRASKVKSSNAAVMNDGKELSSIVSPWVDFICVGGLSIVVMLFLLAYIMPSYSWEKSEASVSLGSVILLQALINWPHFMASYRLLYSPKENIRRYPAASIWVPCALVVIIFIAVITGEGFKDGILYVNQDVSYFVWLGAAFYLAWHYTGQVWGMVSTFAHLHKVTFLPQEKLVLRGGLRILLVWHVIWGMQDLPAHWLGIVHNWIPVLLQIFSYAAIVAFLASIYVFYLVKRRTGVYPTSQLVSPVVAIYLWYLVLYFEPSAYVFVQLSHSLQYLIFPLRVEMNRKGVERLRLSDLKEMVWLARYYLVLVAIGSVLFYVPNLLEAGSQVYTIGVLLASGIAIHHYFVDGAIWKIGDPHVRESLFKHLN